MLLYCIMIEILTHDASLKETMRPFIFYFYVVKSHYNRIDAATGRS